MKIEVFIVATYSTLLPVLLQENAAVHIRFFYFFQQTNIKRRTAICVALILSHSERYTRESTAKMAMLQGKFQRENL
jgi:hypothetical protein